CDPWPFSLAWGDKPNALDVGEPGFIRRRRKPDHAGSNPAIQTLKRKGKPTGDGTRLLPGRALRLEGSTPSPSALQVPVAERPRRRSSKPNRRVRLPPGTLNDAGGPGGETDIMAPSEGAGPGSTPGRGTDVCFDGERDITRFCEVRVP